MTIVCPFQALVFFIEHIKAEDFFLLKQVYQIMNENRAKAKPFYLSKNFCPVQENKILTKRRYQITWIMVQELLAMYTTASDEMRGIHWNG